MRNLRRIKELVAEFGLRGAALVGKDATVLDALSSTDDFYMQVDPSFTAAPDPPETDDHVLLPVVQGREGVGSSPYHMCVFAHAFGQRGYDPIIPLCGCDLTGCFEKPHGARSYSYCARCEHAGTTLLNKFGLEPTPLASVLDSEIPSVDDETINNLETYRSVPVGDLAMASTRRSLARRRINLENPDHRAIYRGYLDSALVLTDAAHTILDENDVAATVAWDASYIYGGCFMHAANERGIPAYQCGSGYSNNTLMFGRADNVSALPQFKDRAVVEEYLEQPLSTAEQTAVEDVMTNRFGGSDVLEPIASANESVDTSEYDIAAGLFTNLTWDASLEAMDIIFDSLFECIETTVEFVRDHPEILLVIKTHPAEAVYGTSEPVAKWIRSEFNPLPDNLRVLDPDTNVSPYELLHDLDVGIVYNSTIGLEMAYSGVPVVVAGQTHYRGLRFTYDPDTVADYKHLLNRLGSLTISPEQETRAERYAHLLFVREQLSFPELFPDTAASPVTYQDVITRPEYNLVVDRVVSNDNIISEDSPPISK